MATTSKQQDHPMESAKSTSLTMRVVKFFDQFPLWINSVLAFAALCGSLIAATQEVSFRIVEVTLIFVVSIVFHEAFHALILNRKHVETRYVVIPILGAAITPKDEANTAKANTLPWHVMGTMLLAGPVGNLVLMMLGLICRLILEVNFPYMHHQILLSNALITLNGGFALFNLLPFGKLDGGQFMHVIHSSLAPQDERWILWLAGGATICVVVIFWAIGNIVAPFFLVVLWGTWKSSHKDNEEHSKSVQAMTRALARGLVLQYIVLLALVTFLGMTTPSWLSVWAQVLM